MIHFFWSINTPQNIIDAFGMARTFHGPRWTAAEWAEWRETRGRRAR
jgi:hypothetical protein